MFGKKRIQELESKLYEADDTISKLTREKTDLEERLNSIVYYQRFSTYSQKA